VRAQHRETADSRVERAYRPGTMTHGHDRHHSKVMEHIENFSLRKILNMFHNLGLVAPWQLRRSFPGDGRASAA